MLKLKPEISVFESNKPLVLESGESLPALRVTYTTAGTLSPEKDNVVWVFHALTANADPFEWWPGVVGSGEVINPENHFIVCANILGSCYGTTGPTSESGRDFPLITIRDMVRVHRLLFEHLGLSKIKLGIGGSMGGQQLLEWATQDPDLFENICALATNARHSAWGIGFNEAQRMALEADPTLFLNYENAGEKGLQAARAIAMLSYRNQNTYNSSQTDSELKHDDFRASSYQRYQGEKLSRRFTASAYWYLSKAMDSHHIGKHHGSIEDALATITAKTIVIGIASDLLFPIEEQKFIAQHIPDAEFHQIDSLYGHDGFLIEYEKISKRLKQLLTK